MLNETNEHLESEADRLSELETCAWIDFYGEKEVIDDIKVYIFRRDIIQMKEENKKLKDFTNWENHPALKHKVVIDEDHYLEHLNDKGELIHQDELEELQDKVNDREQKISDILSFIAGKHDKEDIVKALIKEEFTEEYIKCNGEFWSAVGLEFD
jgi:hypothetical protein